MPQYKIGDCSQCPDKNVPCVKVRKLLFCKFKCHKNNKAKQQMDKAKLKQQVRGLNNYQSVSGMDKVISQQIWFEKKRTEMTGVCLICEGKTSKHEDKNYKRSIAHLLAKKPGLFPSVATHEDNWIELCFWSPSCHTNFDQSTITFSIIKEKYPKAWEVIVEKFKRIFPNIAGNEIKNLPDILLKELSEEDIGWKDMENKLDNE